MSEENLLYADETYAIRGAVFEVYKEMGNAFGENVYQEYMEIALKERGVESEGQCRDCGCPSRAVAQLSSHHRMLVGSFD